MRTILTIWAALIALCLSGCHSTPAMNTTTGLPEVVIQGKSRSQILQASTEFFVHRGYALKPSDNGNKLILDRRSEKPGQAPSGSNCVRVRLALVDLNNGTYRLTGTPFKVEGCGGELEAEHVMPVSFPQIQALLEEIRSQLQFAK